MKITSIQLGPKYWDKQRMMTALARHNFCVKDTLAKCDSGLVERLKPMTLSDIDEKVKSGGNLSFEEAFSGMTFVISATNNVIRQTLFPKMDFAEAIAKGTAFLQLMAVKEALGDLSYEEIAGMAGAATLDIVFRPQLQEVTETCGMGGDRGWKTKEVKTISASTLSAFVLASLDIPTFKHGSYGNTTRVGSTDVPINFGAHICQNRAEGILELFAKTHFWYSDAHSVKTIHYLSHLIMVETINHIVGPMTIPVSKETQLFKVIGVNHHVYAETVAKAYALLHQKGFINLGGVVVVCGLDEVPREHDYRVPEWVKRHSFLDEVSPRATLVSLARKDHFLGSFILTDESFDAPPLEEECLKVPNTSKDLMRANETALRGSDLILSSYLARNAALGILAASLSEENTVSINELPSYYRRCYGAITAGESFRKLEDYVKASGGSFKSWL